VLGYLRKVDHNAIKKDLEQIRHAASLKEAQKALGRFSERWGGKYPEQCVWWSRTKRSF
jgi:transposase-like protein